MLKKTKFIYITLILSLLICLFFDCYLQSEISYLSCAYFFVFSALAIYLILRGLVFKIDTNLYLGIVLLASPISQILLYFECFDIFSFMLVCSIVLSLASLVVWKYFKDKSHKLLFFVFVGEIVIFSIPFCLTKFNIWYLIVIAICWLVLVTIINVVKKKIKHR